MRSWSSATEFARTEGPPLSVALIAVDRTLHLGSFALECLAFLAAWAVLGKVYRTILATARPEPAHATTPARSRQED